ncbi:MAG: hypothetical protein G01um10143_241 [Parcubacteria group bacterium Gr01-1014_3]|nr:MAG: hypothetical protein G01um10143_241 [Parcubacteria group bacterium Gr01-1014_3]
MAKYQLRFNVPFEFYSIQEDVTRPPNTGIEFKYERRDGRKDSIQLKKLDFYDADKRVIVLKDGWTLYKKEEIKDEHAETIVMFSPPPEHNKSDDNWWERLIFSVDPEGQMGLLAEVKDLETGEVLWPWPKTKTPT